MRPMFVSAQSTLRVTRSLLLALGVAAAGFLPFACIHAAEAPTAAIKVDQVGYPLHGPKMALVSTAAGEFTVRRTTDGAVEFRGKLTPAQSDPDTGDTVQAADFSALEKPGNYYLEVPGVGRSWNFAVDRSVYAKTLYLAMRAFYGQRCGIAVDLGSEFPGYSHPACHSHGDFNPTSGKSGPRDNLGGWHDAGDYGRYIVNSGITTGTLLWAWEIYAPKLRTLGLQIPESGNGTPDFLNEIRWNLKWMLAMQDEDGGVWHKQTSTHFPGFISPEADTLPSEVIGTGTAPYKSTCATADFAAVAAIAARVYKPHDAAFAAKALEAAQRAWAWTGKNPNVIFRNPPDISTGEYGDSNCADERLWAAAELWRTTGDAQYNDYFLAHYAEYLPSIENAPPESWNQMAPMALRAYAMSKQKGTDARAVDDIRTRALASAHAVVDRIHANAYRIGMRSNDYVWGSNGVAAQYAVDLLLANQLQPDPAFVNAARDILHYLLGRNTFSLSFVTQVGDNAVKHPHHRPSGDGRHALPWPGLLSGGPNAGRQDAILAALPPDLPPAKNYADQTASYASNEVAINWQAALVFLLAGEQE